MSILTLLGDYYHSHDQLAEFIHATLHKREIEDSSVHTILSQLEKKPALFILSKENRTTPDKDEDNPWLTDQIDQAIWDYVTYGGRMLVLHAGLSSYPEQSLVRQLSKGHFLHHPPEHHSVTYQGTTSDLKGVSFTFPDEHYFVQVDEQDTEVFLKSSSEHGAAVAGWRHQMGEGKVLCLTPAHTKEGFENEDFRTLFIQAVKWLFD